MNKENILSRALGVLLLVIAASTTVVLGVPANPRMIELVQPDGTTIELHFRGDEYVHWLEDREGFTVIRDMAQRFVYADRSPVGELEATDMEVGKVDPKQMGLEPHMLPQQVSEPSVRQTSTATLLSSEPSRVSLFGTIRNLVLLVNFSDVAVGYSTTEFDALFNTVGYSDDGAAGSVKDYYNEVSYGNLNAVSTVVESVTLANPYYYAGRHKPKSLIIH